MQPVSPVTDTQSPQQSKLPANSHAPPSPASAPVALPAADRDAAEDTEPTVEQHDGGAASDAEQDAPAPETSPASPPDATLSPTPSPPAPTAAAATAAAAAAAVAVAVAVSGDPAPAAPDTATAVPAGPPGPLAARRAPRAPHELRRRFRFSEADDLILLKAVHQAGAHIAVHGHTALLFEKAASDLRATLKRVGHAKTLPSTKTVWEHFRYLVSRHRAQTLSRSATNPHISEERARLLDMLVREMDAARADASMRAQLPANADVAKRPGTVVGNPLVVTESRKMRRVGRHARQRALLRAYRDNARDVPMADIEDADPVAKDLAFLDRDRAPRGPVVVAAVAAAADADSTAPAQHNEDAEATADEHAQLRESPNGKACLAALHDGVEVSPNDADDSQPLRDEACPPPPSDDKPPPEHDPVPSPDGAARHAATRTPNNLSISPRPHKRMRDSGVSVASVRSTRDVELMWVQLERDRLELDDVERRRRSEIESRRERNEEERLRIESQRLEMECQDRNVAREEREALTKLLMVLADKLEQK